MMIYAILLAALYAGSCTAQMGMGMMGMGMGMGMGCSIDPKCYIPCPDYTLADAFPFIRQTPVSCDDCMKLCNKLQTGTAGPYMCASAVYDAQVGSCDIFAVRDMGGMGRKKRDGNCGGGNNCNQKQPHKQKYPGRIYLTPTGMCAGQGGNDTGSTAAGGATTSAGSYGGETTTTASTTSSTTSASAAKKKMIKDQAPVRRKDAVKRVTPCIAATTSDHKTDCSRGSQFVGTRKVNCVPQNCHSG